MKKTVLIFCGLFALSLNSFSQWFRETGGWIHPITITDKVSIGIPALTSPAAPLEIQGVDGPLGGFTNAGWGLGIKLIAKPMGGSALVWDKGNVPSAPFHFFMVGPANNPLGDFYMGFAANYTSTTVPIYTQKMYAAVRNNNPIGSTHFYRNIIIHDGSTAPTNRVGIGVLDPQNTLEINSVATSPGPNNSGLTFTDLNSGVTPIALNPGTGVLAVDGYGRVVYVPHNGFGAVCGSSFPFDLSYNWRVGLGGKTLYFEGQGGDFANNVAIGYNCGDQLLGKLNVVQRVPTVINNHTTSSAGIFHSAPDTPCNFSVGVLGRSTGHTTLGIGVAGIADGVGAVGNQWAFGIYGETTPIGFNDESNRNWAGVFNGPAITNVAFVTSDSMLKINIEPITNCLTIIDSLKPVSFLFDTATANATGLYLPGNKQYGFLAQDVEKLLPELVTEALKPAQYDTLGNEIHPAFTFKALNYNAFTGILMQGIKELDSIAKHHAEQNDSLNNSLKNEIDSLKLVINDFNDRFKEMEEMINNCCSSEKNSILNPEGNAMPTTEVELANLQAIVLDQNVPNPFKENTVIAYFIPDNIKYAQIIFTDNYGKIMKTVDITAPGQGMLKVYAANLSTGIYQYSLIIDGKVLETKKMVCTK